MKPFNMEKERRYVPRAEDGKKKPKIRMKKEMRCWRWEIWNSVHRRLQLSKREMREGTKVIVLERKVLVLNITWTAICR